MWFGKSGNPRDIQKLCVAQTHPHHPWPPIPVPRFSLYSEGFGCIYSPACIREPSFFLDLSLSAWRSTRVLGGLPIDHTWLPRSVCSVTIFWVATMSAKAIREVDGKRILCDHLESYGSKYHAPFKAVQIIQGMLMYSSGVGLPSFSFFLLWRWSNFRSHEKIGGFYVTEVFKTWIVSLTRLYSHGNFLITKTFSMMICDKD